MKQVERRFLSVLLYIELFICLLLSYLEEWNDSKLLPAHVLNHPCKGVSIEVKQTR